MSDLTRYIFDLSELIEYLEGQRINPDAFRFDGALVVLKRDLARAEAVANKVSAYSRSTTTMLGEIKRDDDDECDWCIES
jgi:hypothetical protein